MRPGSQFDSTAPTRATHDTSRGPDRHARRPNHANRSAAAGAAPAATPTTPSEAGVRHGVQGTLRPHDGRPPLRTRRPGRRARGSAGTRGGLTELNGSTGSHRPGVV